MARGTKRIAVKGLICGVLFLFLAVAGTAPCLAKVSTEIKCSVCHTMHNSQAGESMVVGGGDEQPNLLRNTCLGCHSATDGSTWKDSATGAPIVYNTSAPSYGATIGDGKRFGLAAGNFYWVTQDCEQGHDIFTADTYLTEAPGNNRGCDNDSCHKNLHEPYTGSSDSHLVGRSGCQGCHMVSGDADGASSVTSWHHANDGTSGTAYIVDTAEQGWYRFLSGHHSAYTKGVSGIEDPDWEHSPTSTVHNEYLASHTLDAYDSKKGMIKQGKVMTGFCSGCHGEFHWQSSSLIGGAWYRHPSDYFIPNEDEYAGMSTTYNPLVPVARWTLSAVSPTVAPGTDLVMCLSCHRAHAGPYNDMLRWDYQNADDLTSAWGCLQCHTEK